MPKVQVDVNELDLLEIKKIAINNKLPTDKPSLIALAVENFVKISGKIHPREFSLITNLKK